MFDLFYVLLHLLFCCLVGLDGERRTIGFMKSVIVSLLLTPLVGFIITRFYPIKKLDSTKMLEEIGKTEDE
jgi:hypothetical protein